MSNEPDMEADPIELMFGGLEKLGPGSDKITRQVLKQLPYEQFKKVLDIGCGSGRQTMALGELIQGEITAIDNHQPFLDQLDSKLKERSLKAKIETRCLDMNLIESSFEDVDLIWSEGAAYNIGVEQALSSWQRALRDGGYLVLSELVWLKPNPPEQVLTFFEMAYPAMTTIEKNCQFGVDAGLELISTSSLPPESWTEGYYDVLQSRATRLVEHPNQSVREFAEETIDEIEVFHQSDNSYGYEFFTFRCP